MSGIALKFTSLLLRTIAKPIAVTLKAQAKEHEAFRQACIRVAQTLHLTDIKLRMRLLGENKIKIRPLNDKKAIDSGANFLLEAFIFLVAGGLILYESNRSRVKASTEKQAVRDDILELQGLVADLKTQLEKIEILLVTLDQAQGQKPAPSASVPGKSALDNTSTSSLSARVESTPKIAPA